MKLRLDLAASIPKDPEQADLNEDNWAASLDLTCFAVSDGASESYDSKRWSEMLVQKYVSNPDFLPDWVHEAVTHYNNKVDFSNLSWSQQMAFDRGSYATLLTLQLAENGAEVEILAVGDSLAIHCRAGEVLMSYPFNSPEQFDERPQLLSTLSGGNDFLAEANLFHKRTCKTWHICEGDVLYLLTDAVGQWVLRALSLPLSSVEELAKIDSVESFLELVLRCRSEGTMKLDDSTMLRLVVENG